jgi:hypothetical protein
LVRATRTRAVCTLYSVHQLVDSCKSSSMSHFALSLPRRCVRSIVKRLWEDPSHLDGSMSSPVNL